LDKNYVVRFAQLFNMHKHKCVKLSCHLWIDAAVLNIVEVNAFLLSFFVVVVNLA